MTTLMLALAPIAILLSYIWLRDKYEREPWSMLLKALGLGAVSVIPILFVERFLMGFIELFQGYFSAFWQAFVVAALTEELFKYLFLYLLIWRSRDFSDRFDGIVYGVFISLGFAAVENIMYVTSHGHTVGLTRALTAVPAHFLFGVTMGYFMGRARFNATRRIEFRQKALLIPILLHGVYDFILMSGSQLLLIGFVPFIIWMWVSGLKKMKQLSNESLFRMKYPTKDKPFRHE